MGNMDRGGNEGKRVKTGFPSSTGEMWYGWGRRDSGPVLTEAKAFVEL